MSSTPLEKQVILGTSRKAVKIYIYEKEYNCILCAKIGMQNALINQIKISDAMIRNSTTVTWKGIQINCIRHKDPKIKFDNLFASHVMQIPIVGHAVLFSKSILTAQMVKDDMEPPKPSSWSNMASLLPKILPLTQEQKQEQIDKINAKKILNIKIVKTNQTNEGDWFSPVGEDIDYEKDYENNYENDYENDK